MCVCAWGTACWMLDTQLKATDIWLKLDYTITNVPIKTSCIIHNCASRHDNYLINILPTWGSAETGPPVIPWQSKQPCPWDGWTSSLDLPMSIHRSGSHRIIDSHHRAKSSLLGPSFFLCFLPHNLADPIMFSAGPRTERFLLCATFPGALGRQWICTVFPEDGLDKTDMRGRVVFNKGLNHTRMRFHIQGKVISYGAH